MKRFFFIIYCLLSFHILEAALEKTTYSFSLEPIDVVIPCAAKDREILLNCIEGIRKYGENIRRIIVISKEKLTSNAEWFSEDNFPFTKEDLAYEIFHGDKKKGKKFLTRKHSRIGWIFQQFLKLYAPFVIPGISPNVLIIDADLVFINKTSFMNEKGEPFFNIGKEYHRPYFEHMNRVLPDLKRVDENLSGITHHMLFQKPLLEDLFDLISQKHNTLPWKALCRTINLQEAKYSPLSEYEIYFNFALLRTNQAKIRPLSFIDISHLKNIEKYQKLNYNYVTSHNYL